MADQKIPGAEIRAQFWPRVPQYDADAYEAILDSYGVNTAAERRVSLEENISEMVLIIEEDSDEKLPAEEIVGFRQDIRGIIEKFKARRWEQMFVEGPEDAA